MSLLAALPAPKQALVGTGVQQQQAPAAAAVGSSVALTVAGAGRPVPPYPRRKGFVPRRQEDFGDGGAYPELPLLQYPRDMGRPDEARGGKTLAVSVDIDGSVSYDAILRQGARANKVIHSGHKALVPKVDLLDPAVRGTALLQQRGCCCCSHPPPPVLMSRLPILHMHMPHSRGVVKGACGV